MNGFKIGGIGNYAVIPDVIQIIQKHAKLQTLSSLAAYEFFLCTYDFAVNFTGGTTFF